mmetsp:Transcript_25672/g.4311  ORF Transcript_25672/g.4311 Transcript_25672/m.4311 type:complete len:93 (+) Transcript_25672:409-687(+)
MFLWIVGKTSGDIFLKEWGILGESELYMNLYLYFSVAGTFLILLRTIIITVFGIKGAKTIHDLMVNRLTKAPINLFYDVTPIGRVLNRLSKD